MKPLLFFATLWVAAAQQPAPVADSEALTIFVLQGQGAINNIASRSVTVPVVEVRDENQRLIPGAEVVFTLPPTGAGAYFPNQQLIYKTFTSPQGQAGVPSLALRSEPGTFKIQVQASWRRRQAAAEIVQTNSTTEFSERPLPPKKSRKKWYYLAAAGAAAAGGITYGVTRSGNDSIGSGSVVLVPGAVVIGGR